MGYSYKHGQFVLRHQYPRKSSALFSFHKHPNGVGGFIDDGICELCGTRGSYVLVEDEKPRCCYKCYMKLRNSKDAPIDSTGLQSAKYISLAEAKQIVRSSNGFQGGILEGLLNLLGNSR